MSLANRTCVAFGHLLMNVNFIVEFTTFVVINYLIELIIKSWKIYNSKYVRRQNPHSKTTAKLSIPFHVKAHYLSALQTQTCN